MQIKDIRQKITKSEKYILRSYMAAMAAFFMAAAVRLVPHMNGIFFPPDEYGYWSNAAAIFGYDWTEINLLNPYYGFGYSLLLVPGMMLTNHMTLLYRAAILLNIFFAFLHGLVLLQILRKLFPKAGLYQLLVINSVAALYPSILVYMQYTLAEVLLNLLFLLLIRCLMGYLESPSVKYALLSGLTAVSLYCVHMRSIGIVLAAVFMMGMYFFLQKKKENDGKMSKKSLASVICFILLLGGGILFGELFKYRLQDTLYQGMETGLAAANDYGGRISQVLRLFTWQGILDFTVSCIGKLCYLGNATFGLFYFAVFFLMKKVRNLRNGKGYIYFFLLCAIVLNFVIAAVGMMDTSRIDGVLYGRYNETIVPIMICLGLIEIFSCDNIWKRLMQNIALQIAFIGIVSIYVNMKNITEYLPDFAIAVAYAAGQTPDKVSTILLYPHIAGCVGSIVMVLIVWIIRTGKLPFAALGAVACMYVMIALNITVTNILPHQRDARGDLEVAATIRELQQENSDREIYLLHSDWNEYGDILQFFLPDRKIHVTMEDEFDLFALGEQDLIVTYKNDERDEALQMIYNTIVRSWHLNVYYNQ